MGGLDALADGLVIPAIPLALTESLELDERRQRALVRYYLASGAGGVAVAVHSTQFAIHDTHRRLLAPLLRLVAETVRESGGPDTVLIAGAVGDASAAVDDARLAHELGYDAVLLTPRGARDLGEDAQLDRAARVSQVLPTIGFALQPAVGGAHQPAHFWRRLAELPGVVGVKAAPFDRYATIDLVRGIAESSRRDEIALYTGNDDHIVGDLLSDFPLPDGGELHFRGGLLGQWSMWTSRAVTLLSDARRARDGDPAALARLRGVDVPLTDANGAIFDAAHGFVGCIPGIHEVLRRQGLLEGLWCLDPHETLSPGQLEQIDRIWKAYPFLRDDDFVEQNLAEWLS